VAFLDREKFPWNDCYIATAEPGHLVDATLVGVQGEHFMARTSSEILIGNTSDLPSPRPARGEAFRLLPAILKKPTKHRDWRPD
jgi:cell filamentation protein